MKIATLIISSNTYPALRNSKVQKKLFFEQNFDQKLTFWYKAGNKSELLNKKFNVIDNDLLIDTDDGTTNMGKKTILALEWLDKNVDYDFVVRPTPSSYIHFDNLSKFIKDNLIHESYVYSGKIQSTNDIYGNKIDFVSGSTLILNKNTVQKIIENQHLWNHTYWDDVALSLLLKEVNVVPQPSNRFDVKGNALLENIPKNFYQYRCRADNHYNYPRYLETINMTIVHKITNNKKIHLFEKNLLKLYFYISKLFYIYQFGWKVFIVVKKVTKFLLPKVLYDYFKEKLRHSIEKFKHVRFKV